MKKIISLVIAALILTGCVDLNSTNIYESLEKTVEIEEEKQYNIRNNNFTDYVNYYLPSDMSEIDCDLTTFTFKYNDSVILYNINIADLINNKYYPDEILNDNNRFYDEKYLFFEHRGNIETLNRSGDYIVRVYEVESEYLLSFTDLDSQIYAYATKGDVVEVLRHIFILAKLSRVDEEKVITSFSDKDVISATKKTISLFNYVYPSSGYLSDLVNKPSQEEIIEEENNIIEEYYDEEVPEEDFEENLEVDEDEEE